MAERVPQAAVVIATRGRETRLAFALEALAAQTLSPEDFEVVVVRDGGVPERAAQAPPGPAVRFLTREPAGGPGAARNVGWRATEAPLIAFTDDDCRPAPGWLEALLGAAGGQETIVQGATEPDPEERHLLGGLARSQFVDRATGWYETCNMAYPRELLERLDGFDETFELAGEDTDLALRALAAGARSVFEPRALVWHAVLARHLPAALRDTLRWRSVPRLLRRHPAQRRAIYLGWFWKESHARLLLAATGALVARRRPLAAALLGLPYLELYLRTYDRTPRGLTRAALDLPARVAVDALETAVTARAAVRERVPVL